VAKEQQREDVTPRLLSEEDVRLTSPAERS
jgi:hypothetical protein